MQHVQLKLALEIWQSNQCRSSLLHYQMQHQSCLMICNLVARNPENRTILLSNGIEKLIRRAKGSHQSCKDAATAALRDLGLDDYNA